MRTPWMHLAQALQNRGRTVKWKATGPYPSDVLHDLARQLARDKYDKVGRSIVMAKLGLPHQSTDAQPTFDSSSNRGE